MRREFVVVCSLLFMAVPARAAPGDLDPVFSGDGVATAFPKGSIATSIAIDSQGRTVVAGYTLSGGVDVAIARFLPDGSLDPSFGESGRVRIDLGGTDHAFDLVVLANDAMAVAGRLSTADREVAFVLRLTPGGRPKPAFGGGDGLVTVAFGRPIQEASAIDVSPGGRLVIGGFASNGTASRSVLARLLPDGTLDTAFSGDGRAAFNLSDGAEQIHDIEVLTDGSILAAGEAEAGVQPRFSLLKATPQGILDAAFGQGGAATTDLGPGADVANAIDVYPHGRIVLAGSASNGGLYDWGVARYTPEGALDTRFSDDGELILPMSDLFEEATGVLQANGDLVVAGKVRSSGSYDLAVVRLTGSGTLDTSFSGDGMVAVDVFSSTDAGRAVALRPNGKIEVAGEAWRDGTPRFVVVRLLAA